MAKPLLRRSSAFVVVALATVVTGCADDPPQPVTQPKVKVVNAGLGDSNDRISTVVRGGTAGQRVLVRELVARIDGRNIRLVKIHRPPGGWRASRRAHAFGNLWLTIHVRSKVGGEHSVEAGWKANLLAGAFRDTAPKRGLGKLLGFTAVREYPLGPPRETGQLLTGPFLHPTSDASPQALTQALKKKLEVAGSSAGVRRVTLRFIKPIHLAAIVDVVVIQPEGAARTVSAINSLQLEGLLIRFQSPEGVVNAASSSAVRTGRGGSWMRQAG